MFILYYFLYISFKTCTILLPIFRNLLMIFWKLILSYYSIISLTLFNLYLILFNIWMNIYKKQGICTQLSITYYTILWYFMSVTILVLFLKNFFKWDTDNTVFSPLPRRGVTTTANAVILRRRFQQEAIFANAVRSKNLPTFPYFLKRVLLRSSVKEIKFANAVKPDMFLEH